MHVFHFVIPRDLDKKKRERERSLSKTSGECCRDLLSIETVPMLCVNTERLSSTSSKVQVRISKKCFKNLFYLVCDWKSAFLSFPNYVHILFLNSHVKYMNLPKSSMTTALLVKKLYSPWMHSARPATMFEFICEIFSMHCCFIDMITWELIPPKLCPGSY